MFLLWLLSVVGLGYWVYQLQQRIRRLESPDSVAQTTVESQVPEAPVSETEANDGIDRSKWPEHLQKSVHTKAANPTTKPKKDFDFEQFLGQKLFPILGAASIVIAIGFFAIWSFANGWVGPMGRIAIGILVSLGLMGLGEFLKKKYPDFYPLLSAAGLAGLIITTLISHYAYDFITAFQALVLLALQAGAGVLLSLRYESRVLANLSIAAGLLAPWFTGQLDPMLVLPFVLVLTVAGFAMALYRKWPEIFVGLLLFGSSYVFAAVAKLNRQALEFDRDFAEALAVLGDAVVNPYLLIAFAAIMYGLIGSAGIVRLITKYKDKEPPKEESKELVLFSLALVLFNLCLAGVFNAQDWQHIGFAVLLQAAGLLSLAQWFEGKGWHHFKGLTLSTSLLFIILATLWELRNFDSLLLTLALAVEAIIMCVIGQLSKQKVYEWFGRATLLIAYFSSFVVSNTDFLLEVILSVVFVTSFLYSVGKPQHVTDKIWFGISLFFSTVIIFDLCFDNRSDVPALVAPLIPTLWTCGLVATAYKFKSNFLRISSAIIFAITTIFILNNDVPTDGWYLTTWSYIFIMALALFWLRARQAVSEKADTFLGYAIVLIAALSWIYQTAYVLEEPFLTLAWLVLVGTLMTLGLIYKQYHELRYVGLGWILFMVAKLYLVDVWQWDTPIRVVAFTALGGALLAIGFFYQKIWLKK